MNDPKRRFFSGDTLLQALVQAGNYFNLDPDYVAYRAIDKRHGFLKTRRKVMIEVDPDAPRREPKAAAARVAAPLVPEPMPAEAAGSAPLARPAPATAARREGRPPDRDRSSRRGDHRRHDRGGERPPRTAPPPREVESARFAAGEEEGLVTLPERPRPTSERFPPATGPTADAARKGLDLLLGIAGLDLAARIHQGEERLEIELSGGDAERCFDDEGELLRAIEHLLPRVIRSQVGEGVLCRVDCDSFHEIREEQLRTLAQRVAEEVRRRGRSRTLEPMNPADRRVIHMTLADDPGVATESDGEGYFKRITVRPR
ncbi:MAG TPA: R3H domain-containing nucleic acid-binding protein [Thermoanaerobaculia bacterium]|nr:R3H domain-containing nucleic acid-binding protein [Thermoanaerobaculia bacterium]